MCVFVCMCIVCDMRVLMSKCMALSMNSCDLLWPCTDMSTHIFQWACLKVPCAQRDGTSMLGTLGESTREYCSMFSERKFR